MTTNVAAGPSGESVWESKQLGGVDSLRPLTFLLLPDAANNFSNVKQSPIYYFLPRPPRVVRGGPTGTPVFTMTLLLDHLPGPTDENINSFIEKSIVNFDITLAVAADLIDELEKEQQAVCAALFAREATFDLLFSENGSHRTIFQTTAAGTDARVTISATLDREATLDFLAALEERSTGFNLSINISYRALSRETIRLTGSWANIYDALQADLGKNSLITRDEIRDGFFNLMEGGIIKGYRISSDLANEITDQAGVLELFNSFMRLSSTIFRQEASEFDTAGVTNYYAFRGRPPQIMQLNYSQVLSIDHQKSISFEVGLEEILGGILDGLDRSGFIHLVSLAADEDGTVKPVPRRVRTLDAVERRDATGMAASEGRLKLAAVGGEITSAAFALQPNSAIAVPSQLLIANQSAKPVIGNHGLIKNWQIDDLILERPESSKVKSLPIVEDPSAPIWPDRLDPSKFWYAPVFGIVPPNPTMVPSTSPFLFLFERVGTTNTGKPALLGDVRFTLQKRMSESTMQALKSRGNPAAQPLPTSGLSISLDIPFIDESDGKLKIHRLPAIYQTAANDNTITCSIRLINDWVRLCYGALSVPGFQSEPARITVSYSYQAYVQVRREIFDFTISAKEALIPIAKSSFEAQKLDGVPFFDAQKVIYHNSSGEMRFRREALESSENVKSGNRMLGEQVVGSVAMGGIGRHLNSERNNAVLAAATGTINRLKPKPVSGIVVARPPFKIPPKVAEIIRQTNYATRSFVREEKHEIFVPCSSLGMFYQQVLPEGNVAVGCREALSLGQTTYRLYEEIPELSTSFYRVYRFLQQPDRFLVLPANYCITRYERGEGTKAYRPCIILYSVFDSLTPANNRVMLSAALQPDIPLFARRELLFKLSAYARDPIIHYPTEIESEVEYAWTIGSGLMIEPNAVKTPDAFQVTLTSDLAGALLLCNMLERHGVHGSVRFKLSDGSSLQTNLTLELGRMTGPWVSGPLEISPTQGEVRLVNKIERKVTVSDLVVSDGTGATTRIPVEKDLSSNESHAIAVPGQPTEAVAVYSIPPGEIARLEEARSFVEELYTNVIFVNLINFANHGLREMDIQVRLEGVVPEQTVAMSGTPPSGKLDLIMPLTTFLEKQILQIRIRKIFNSGEAVLTPWLDWDLDTQGNVVSLTWELIA
jgi:hypothetical protein